MEQDTTLKDFYAPWNSDAIGVILITPKQMIIKSGEYNYHRELVEKIYNDIYERKPHWADVDDNWIEEVTKSDNTIFVKLTKTDFLAYLPDYINTTQYQYLNILNNKIKEMLYLPFKISFADMRLFDKNHDNLDELTNYFFRFIDDSIDSNEKILENNMKKVI